MEPDNTATKPSCADFLQPRMGEYMQRSLKPSFSLSLPGQDYDPTRMERTLMATFPQGRVVQIEDFLSATECDQLMDEAEKLEFAPVDWEYRADYRECNRVVTKNAKIAAEFWRRLLLVLEPGDIENLQPYGYGNRGTWVPHEVNECLRFTRYDCYSDSHFSAHRDGAFVRNDSNQSILTLMIYLNDVPVDGHTRFLKDPLSPDDEVLLIKPVQGRALVFNHDVWHAGDLVSDAPKYILRTDIMFRKIEEPELEPQFDLSTHPEYLRAQELYHKSIVLQQQGDPGGSTRCYLEAQAIQAALSSTSQQSGPPGPEMCWFPMDVWRDILRRLSIAELTRFAQVSRACARLANDNELWAELYARRWPRNLPRAPGYLLTQHWPTAFKHRWQADDSFRPVIFYFTPEYTYVSRAKDSAIRVVDEAQWSAWYSSCKSRAAQNCGHLWCRGSGLENCLVGGFLDNADEFQTRYEPPVWLLEPAKHDQTTFNSMVLRAIMKYHLELPDADEIETYSYSYWHFHWERAMMRRPLIVMASDWMTKHDCEYILDFMLGELAAPYAVVLRPSDANPFLGADVTWEESLAMTTSTEIFAAQDTLLELALWSNSPTRKAFVPNDRQQKFFD